MSQQHNNNHKFQHRKPSAPPLDKARMLIGRKPIIEALESGRSIDKIFILKTAKGDDISLIKKQATAAQIPFSLVPQEKLDRFTKAQHQGLVAIASHIQYLTLQDSIDHIVSSGETPFLLVLDGITDTRNLGAMARTAHCMGCQAIVLPKSNSAAVTDEAIKTSAGALEHIMICREASIEQIMDTLHLNGIHTISTHLDGDNLLDIEIDAQAPMAVIMGSEDKGISKYVLKNSKNVVRIPQNNNFDSLNVSVATGIILYDIFIKKIKS